MLFGIRLDQKEADFVVAVSAAGMRLLATVGLIEHWMKRKLSMLPSGKEASESRVVGAGMVRTLIEEEKKKGVHFLYS